MKIYSIILSAGKSSRMKSEIPKPFHEIAGKKMIDWVITANSSVDIKKLIIVTPNQNDFLEYSKTNDLVIQKVPKGTGDAVKCAISVLKNFKGIVLICYADTPFISKSTLQKLIKSIKNNNDIAITSFIKTQENSYGKIVLNKEKKPLKILEDKKLNNKINLCNGGIMAFNASKLFTLISKIKPNKESGEYYLTDSIEIASTLGMKIELIKIKESEVLGINDRKQLAFAESMVQSKIREQLLKNGVTLLAPETSFFSYDSIIKKDVIIHPNVIIGKNVKIEKNCEILSFSHLENCTVFKDTKIGPFARIRAGSKIGKNSKIGNFVELKNVDIKPKVKINHLAYVGDTDVGSDSNIGAGTITCNYDGFRKNKTTIGYNTFVGSNSTLIAPIKIGDNATIAAGSVITEDVPKNALSIARKKQENKENRSLKKLK